jgi:HEPN domain-containing protein
MNLLLQAVETFVAVTESLRMACARLNRYYIPTRYPDAFDRGAPADQFFAADARQAIADAEEVLGFATGIIGSS